MKAISCYWSEKKSNNNNNNNDNVTTVNVLDTRKNPGQLNRLAITQTKKTQVKTYKEYLV